MLFTLICLPFYQQIVLKMFFCLLLFFLYSFYLLIKILILGEHRPVSEMGELTVAQSIIATGGFRFCDSPGLCRVLLPNEVVQPPSGPIYRSENVGQQSQKSCSWTPLVCNVIYSLFQTRNSMLYANLSKSNN